MTRLIFDKHVTLQDVEQELALDAMPERDRRVARQTLDALHSKGRIATGKRLAAEVQSTLEQLRAHGLFLGPAAKASTVLDVRIVEMPGSHLQVKRDISGRITDLTDVG